MADGEPMQVDERKTKKKGRPAAADLPDVPMGQLPEHLAAQRRHVVLAPDAPLHTTSFHPSAFMAQGVDGSRSVEDVKQSLRVEVKLLREDRMEFDLINAAPAVANAFRRILIAEVPTMAIEKVFIANNTSIVQDEVLAHRLGLVPLDVDPRPFKYFTAQDNATEENTIVFRLKVRCDRQGNGSKVLSESLEWLPGGSEWPEGVGTTKYTKFTASQLSKEQLGLAERPPRPKYGDIVLAKMRPGQEIELEAHATKGVGKTHAKWSPVATASYRMLPEVVIKSAFDHGQLAEELVKKCPVGVFDIEDLGDGSKRAVVRNPRECTVCHECIRDEGWEEFVELRRVKEHFIFSIESTGALPPEVLFTEACKIMERKALDIASELS